MPKKMSLAAETVYSQSSEDFLHCRDLRHTWEVTTGFALITRTVRKRTKDVYQRDLLCDRCGLVRTDAYDKNLDLVARHYSYPTGYTIPRDAQGTRGAKAVRVEILRREGIL